MSRRKGRLVLVLVLVVLLGVVVVRRYTCLRFTSGEVAMPPVTAGPAEVVRTYVAALDEHDLGTATALSTPEHVDEAEDWHRNLISVSDLQVKEPYPDGSDTGYAEAWWVAVTFDVNRCDRFPRVEGNDSVWGYTVVRNSPAQRWLISNEGPL